jgi:hypothetical protein
VETSWTIIIVKKLHTPIEASSSTPEMVSKRKTKAKQVPEMTTT